MTLIENICVSYSRRFIKQYEKADQKIQKAFDRKLALFLTDSFHPLLNNHELTGQFAGYRSINITGDWRAHYSQSTDEKGYTKYVFELFGTHSQLYR